MTNRLFLVQYEEEDTGEVHTCMVNAPNEWLAGRFMYPHTVLRVVYIDNVGVPGAGDHTGSDDDDFGPAGPDRLDDMDA